MHRKYYCNIFNRDVVASDCYALCKESRHKWCRRRDFNNYFSTSEIRYANDDTKNLLSIQDVSMSVSILVPTADRFLSVGGILEIMNMDYRRALFNSLSINGFDYSVSGKRPVVCDKYINIPKDSSLFEDIIYPTNGAHRAMMCNILKIKKIPVSLNVWDCGADDKKTDNFLDGINMNKIYRKVRRRLNIKNGVLPFVLENIPKRKAHDIWIKMVYDETQKRLGETST